MCPTGCACHGRRWSLRGLASLVVAGTLLPFGTLAQAEEGGEDVEPPASAFEDMTLIRVSSTPSQARVVVDDVPCGQTPALIEVEPGRHEVVVSLGRRRIRTVISVRANRTAEVVAEFVEPARPGLYPWLDGERPSARSRELPVWEDGGASARPRRPSRPSPGAPVWIDEDEEQADVGATRERREVPAPEGSGSRLQRWLRDVPRWPLFDIDLLGGARWRELRVPVEVWGSDVAEVTSSVPAHGAAGIRAAMFLAARSGRERLRGLGLDFLYLSALATESAGGEEAQGSSSYEVGVNLVYRYAWGDERWGANLGVRAGWHRTTFYLNTRHSEFIPPFVYDALRFELGLEVPLGTPHLVASTHGAYLLVLSVGDEAERGLGDGLSDVSSHGGEFAFGLAVRFGGLELGLSWAGRWLVSDFQGIATHLGDGPYHALETTGSATDTYHLLQISLGYRL